MWSPVWKHHSDADLRWPPVWEDRKWFNVCWVSCVTQSLCVGVVLEKQVYFDTDSERDCCAAFTEARGWFFFFLGWISSVLPACCFQRLCQNTMTAPHANKDNWQSKNIFKCVQICAVWAIITVCENEASEPGRCCSLPTWCLVCWCIFCRAR